MRFELIYLFVFSTILISCQTNQITRTPANVENINYLTNYYETQAAIDQISDKISRLQSSRIQNTGEVETGSQQLAQNNLNALAQQKAALEQQAAQQYQDVVAEVKSDYPVSVKIPFNKRWRRHHDELIVHELESYALKDGKIVKKMFLSTDTTTSLYLQLTHFVYSWNKKRPTETSEKSEPTYLRANLTCNQNAVIHYALLETKAPANQTVEFNWYDSKLQSQKTYIEITNPTATCDLKFSLVNDPVEYGIRLIPEAQELARIGSPELQSEICYIPQLQSLKGIDQFFLDAKNYMTCPIKVSEAQTLEESTEGINAKVRILTGQNLSAEYMKAGNPFAPLDFSRAPKLDAILISYLVFRADFGGTVILNALKHHAENGTLIRIALSDVITLGKDRQMLLDFQAEYPNVKLLFYKYKPRGNNAQDLLAAYHRTNHIKFFLTYSNSDQSANKVILGGRNIHDGFVFEQPKSNYIRPDEVVSYGPKGDESWARWEDFETLFTSTDLVKTLMGQFFSVLHADYSAFHIRSYTEGVETNEKLNPNYLNLNDNEMYIRSFVSIPFKDNHLLEATYIKMIDSAEKVIKVSTPYFNLTDGLLQAFERAAARGVEIQLITRLDLKGDTVDFILSDVNKKSVNKLYDKIKIYEYTTPGKILHSKLFLVDNKFVMMGSVNLNLRSFYHDIENATLIYSPGLNKKISAIYDRYKTESRQLTDRQKTTFWKNSVNQYGRVCAVAKIPFSILTQVFLYFIKSLS